MVPNRRDADASVTLVTVHTRGATCPLMSRPQVKYASSIKRRREIIKIFLESQMDEKKGFEKKKQDQGSKASPPLMG